MAVSLLSGFPVSASKPLNSTLTLVTASHSVSGACKIFLCLAAEGTAAITNTAITDSTAGVIGTWTRHVSKVWTGGSKNSFSWTEIWVADCSGAYTSKTITLTITGGGTSNAAVISAYAVTGFNSGTPIGAEDNNAATNGSATHLIAGAVTSTATGSLVIGVGGDGDAFLTFSAQTGTTLDKQVADGTINSSYSTFHKTATTTSGSPYTVGTSKSDDMFVYAVLEIAASSSTVTGTVNVTLADATCAASGSEVTGSLAVTLGATTCAASGSEVTGAVSSTLADASCAASGAHGVAGTVTVNLAGATCVASGSSVTGSLGLTLADATCAASGSQSISGSCAVTLAGATCAASGSCVTGAVSSTLADSSCAASGSVATFGSLAVTLGDATCAASGTFIGEVTGSLAVTLDDATCDASGSFLSAVTGSLEVTLADCSCAAVGTFTNPNPVLPLDGLDVLVTGELAALFASTELDVFSTGESHAVIVRD